MNDKLIQFEDFLFRRSQFNFLSQIEHFPYDECGEHYEYRFFIFLTVGQKTKVESFLYENIEEAQKKHKECADIIKKSFEEVNLWDNPRPNDTVTITRLFTGEASLPNKDVNN